MTRDLYVFLRNYKYKLGPVFIDGWRVIKRKGDCDDFALTVALKLAKGDVFQFLLNIITLKTVFWRVESPQNDVFPRHIALWHKGEGWIDSSFPRKFRDTVEPHEKRWPIPWPLVLLLIVQGFVYSIFVNEE